MSDRSSVLQRGETYPLADQLTLAECKRLGVRSPGGAIKEGDNWADVRAVWTGEKRPPLKGEWYLSGASINAYRAPNDLTMTFHIARLVKTRKRTVIEIIE